MAEDETETEAVEEEDIAVVFQKKDVVAEDRKGKIVQKDVRVVEVSAQNKREQAEKEDAADKEFGSVKNMEVHCC